MVGHLQRTSPIFIHAYSSRNLDSCMSASSAFPATGVNTPCVVYCWEVVVDDGSYFVHNLLHFCNGHISGMRPNAKRDSPRETIDLRFHVENRISVLKGQLLFGGIQPLDRCQCRFKAHVFLDELV